MLLQRASLPSAARAGAALRRGFTAAPQTSSAAASRSNGAGAKAAAPLRMRRGWCSAGTASSDFAMIETADENQRKDLAVVLVSPQIPGNTGTIARTCAATRVPLHLVGPLGFELTDSQLKRAGLDYW
jgi:tRNA (cytidine/uridine-2'-O-)-methyltransferase